MKRFHVHTHVRDLQASIAFYSKLFAAEPTRVESDYAKWMLDDPRINFAISTRGAEPGIDHVGFQTDTEAELAELKARAEAADFSMLDEGQTTCCYARSDKHWIVDPAGVPWEHFHTLADIPVFNEAEGAAAASASAGSACCTPAVSAATVAAQAAPENGTTGANACCPPSRGKPLNIPVKSSGSGCC